MFLGAIFRTVKGGYDAIAIRQKLKEFKKELTTDLLGAFPTYDRFFATERLLIAEYMIELSKLKARSGKLAELLGLKERMNRQMKELVEKAQVELAEHPATKLDIARMVTGLRELSLAVDKDLAEFQQEIAAEQEKLKRAVDELNDKQQQLANQLTKQARQASLWERKFQTISGNIEGLTDNIERIDRNNRKRVVIFCLSYLGLAIGFLFLFWRLGFK